MVHENIETERMIHSYPGAVRWGAIIGGWLFAYAFAMLLFLFGAAAGLTSFAVMNTLNKEVTFATGIWMVASWIVATFVGGFLAARLGSVLDKGTGALHGLLVWALSGIMTLFIGSVQAAAVATTGIAATAGIVEMTQEPGVQPAQEFQDTFSQEFKTQAGEIISQTAGSDQDREKIKASVDQLDQATLGQISAQLVVGNINGAKQTLADQTELSEADIDRLVTNLSQPGGQLQGRAEQAGDVSSAALWALFIASLLGLGAGALGGSVGAAQTARAYHAIEAPYVGVAPYPEHEEIHKRKAV